MSNGENKILIVDGMALLFRGFFAQAYPRRLPDGTATNAIFGFLQYLFDAINTFEPTHVVCCWDMGSKTFRSELYDGYKANRPDAPSDLVPQFDLVKETVAALGIPNVGIPGFEADDCIGTLSRELSAEGRVYILSGDHDLLQLVSETVHVVIMKKGKLNYAVYDPGTLLTERQLAPAQIIDLKAFMGDTSDNYPGVPGIGEKTALKLLLDYRSVEGVLDNLDSLAKGVRAKIEGNLDLLHLSRRLATIERNVPVACAPEHCIWRVRHAAAAARKFEELKLSALLRQLNGYTAEAPSDRPAAADGADDSLVG